MTIKEIFASMDYGAAPESNAEVLAWLAKNKASFGHYIDGGFTAPEGPFDTRNPATGTVLAQVSQGSRASVDTAVKAAARAFPKWSRTSGPQRARILYALARLVQKHSRGISTTTPALLNCLIPRNRVSPPSASAAPSSRGTSPCSCWPGKLPPRLPQAIPSS